MLEVTCSGAYRNNGNLEDFTDLKMLMPDCPEEWVKSNAINRCFMMQAEKTFKKRVDSIHSLYIDSVEKLAPQKNKKGEEVELLPSCCGKKIKSLNWEELQDLAMMFCLRAIPLYRSCDLRSARVTAYKEYVNKIAGGNLEDGFDFAAAADFIVPDVAIKTATIKGNADKVLTGNDVIGEDEKEKA
jgi:hypothetical protein